MQQDGMKDLRCAHIHSFFCRASVDVSTSSHGATMTEARTWPSFRTATRCCSSELKDGVTPVLDWPGGRASLPGASLEIPVYQAPTGITTAPHKSLEFSITPSRPPSVNVYTSVETKFGDISFPSPPEFGFKTSGDLMALPGDTHSVTEAPDRSHGRVKR